MQSCNEGTEAPSPLPASITTRTLEKLGGALTGLVAQMETEIRGRGMVTQASASELRELRLEAERFFGPAHEIHP